MLTDQDFQKISQVIQARIAPVLKDLTAVSKDLTAVSKNLTTVSKDLTSFRREANSRFDVLEHLTFHIDQRLSKIEYKLGLPTPKFDPKQPISEVFVNPIKE